MFKLCKISRVVVGGIGKSTSTACIFLKPEVSPDIILFIFRCNACLPYSERQSANSYIFALFGSVFLMTQSCD